MPKKIQYEKSSGNVFKDLGLKNSSERLLKAEIAATIYEIIKSKDLDQKSAAVLLGIDQPKISALANGRLSGFSIDRLFRFLMALEQEVEITISNRRAVEKSEEKNKIYSIKWKGEKPEKRQSSK